MAGLSIADIRAAISEIQQALPGAASRAPKPAFAKVVDFLSSLTALNVEELITQLEAAKPPAREKKPTTKKPVEPLRDEIVAKHRSALENAESSVEEFEQAIVALSADKKVRTKPELVAIANAYGGGSSKYANKAAALDAIRNVFRERWVANLHDQPPR